MIVLECKSQEMLLLLHCDLDVQLDHNPILAKLNYTRGNKCMKESPGKDSDWVIWYRFQYKNFQQKNATYLLFK